MNVPSYVVFAPGCAEHPEAGVLIRRVPAPPEVSPGGRPEAWCAECRGLLGWWDGMNYRSAKFYDRPSGPRFSFGPLHPNERCTVFGFDDVTYTTTYEDSTMDEDIERGFEQMQAEAQRRIDEFRSNYPQTLDLLSDILRGDSSETRRDPRERPEGPQRLLREAEGCEDVQPRS